MWQNTQEQITVEIGQLHSDDLLEVQKRGCVGAGLDDPVIRFANNQ